MGVDVGVGGCVGGCVGIGVGGGVGVGGCVGVGGGAGVGGGVGVGVGGTVHCTFAVSSAISLVWFAICWSMTANLSCESFSLTSVVCEPHPHVRQENHTPM